MAGLDICVLRLADTCTSEVYPMLNPVAPYGYRLSNMYLFTTYITNPDFLFVVVGPELVSTSPAFVCSSASHPAGPHDRLDQKTVNRTPIAGGGRVWHNLYSSLWPLWQLHRLYAVSFGAIRYFLGCTTEHSSDKHKISKYYNNLQESSDYFSVYPLN